MQAARLKLVVLVEVRSERMCQMINARNRPKAASQFSQKWTSSVSAERPEEVRSREYICVVADCAELASVTLKSRINLLVSVLVRNWMDEKGTCMVRIVPNDYDPLGEVPCVSYELCIGSPLCHC